MPGRHTAALFVHEARHNNGKPHMCGANDQTLAELGAWGAQYYLGIWAALYSGSLLEGPAPDPTAYRAAPDRKGRAAVTADLHPAEREHLSHHHGRSRPGCFRRDPDLHRARHQCGPGGCARGLRPGGDAAGDALRGRDGEPGARAWAGRWCRWGDWLLARRRGGRSLGDGDDHPRRRRGRGRDGRPDRPLDGPCDGKRTRHRDGRQLGFGLDGHDRAAAAAPGRSERVGVKRVGSAGHGRLTGTRGNDVLCGAGGSDNLSGLGGKDVLRGDAGSDLIQGGKGSDRVSGGAGRDRIEARDRMRDFISCGPDRDIVVADRVDSVGGDCESVTRR